MKKMTTYNITELQAQAHGLEMRIKRFKFLRDHTTNTEQIDKEIKRDVINLELIRNIINTKKNK
jgi:hypothetical protein